MAGTINNKNAEKWTEEKAVELAELALTKVGPKCFFLAHIADECDVYKDLFLYLMKKFNDNPIVFRSLKKMYNKAESEIWKQSSEGTIDKTIGIFALKSLHGLMESSKSYVEADVTTNGNSIDISTWIKTNAKTEDADSD